MIPDYCEAITGYRAFSVCENGLLVGQVHAEPWPPFAPFVARCGSVQDFNGEAHVQDGQFLSPPVLACECGIYAYKTLADAEARVSDGVWFSLKPGTMGRAWGCIKLWGRLIEHEDGYRAEFAYPSALWCESAELAAKIAALYGIPCEHKKLADQRTGEFDIPVKFFSGPVYFSPVSPYDVCFTSPLVTSVADDIQAAPMVTPAPRPSVPQGLVGASRWQQRQYAQYAQYAKGMQDPMIRQPHWREILRQMVYKSASER